MILVVDDNTDLCDMICLLLAAIGHQTAVASNGKEAIDWLSASRSPRVILLDLTMPVMDGYQFLAARDLDPALKEVPVVVMSAVHECARLLGRYRISGCVTKPPCTRVLLETIESALQSGQAAAAA